MLVKGLKSDHQIGTISNFRHSRVGKGIASAGVATRWATVRGLSFGGCIVNKIARGTSILEGVIKSDPVTSQVVSPTSLNAARHDLPNFMSKGPSKVEGGLGAAGERRVQNDNTIHIGIISVISWEGGISKKVNKGEADVGRQL